MSEDEQPSAPQSSLVVPDVTQLSSTQYPLGEGGVPTEGVVEQTDPSLEESHDESSSPFAKFPATQPESVPHSSFPIELATMIVVAQVPCAQNPSLS